MFAKIQITGTVTVKTGMHIGGSSAFAAIGAVDSPVMRDVWTNQPMIPGSSLKGKLRTLLAREFSSREGRVPGSPDDDSPVLLRLFGCAAKERIRTSRILVSDMFLLNYGELRQRGLTSATEVKFENTINRLTAVANPRQIERTVRGARFGLDMIYELSSQEEAEEDFDTLALGMRLLTYDYIGGHGSRGYGKIAFDGLSCRLVAGDADSQLVNRLDQIISRVSEPVGDGS